MSLISLYRHQQRAARADRDRLRELRARRDAGQGIIDYSDVIADAERSFERHKLNVNRLIVNIMRERSKQ